MVGAKLTISGESRIITAYSATTAVTVNSAYSQNYSNVSSGGTSWAVYSKSYEIANTGNIYWYSSNGAVASMTSLTASTPLFSLMPNQSIVITGGNAGVVGDNFGFFTSETVFASTYNFKWSSTTAKYGTKDLGLARNSAGVLEITDGTIASGGGGLLANRRDLLVRNLTGSTLNITGTTSFTGGLTANTISATTISGGDIDYMLMSSFRNTYNY
jgi:hypothetical protein